MASEKHGRGKFQHHKNYLVYKQRIVKHPHYKGMPNAVSDGNINWQVSSGKTTAFYKDFLARFAWWVKKADQLRVPGKGNSNDRFSITARLIHPTGWRACLHCGKQRNVGYFYSNHIFAKSLNKRVGSKKFHKHEP